MKNWFLSIELAAILWAFSGCGPGVDPNKNDSGNGDEPKTEEVDSSGVTGSNPDGSQGIPPQGLEVNPGMNEKNAMKSSGKVMDSSAVNPYNTRGPDQEKVDSIKHAKTKRKKRD